MRYLVTGGAGFIGSHLCEALLAQGHQVCAIDDMSTGQEKNIQRLQEKRDFEFVVDSVTNLTTMKRLMQNVDGVFHLAAVVGVRLVLEQPVKTIETNMLATQAVFAAARGTMCPVFLASTSEIYGKNQSLPFREDTELMIGPTTNRRWAYACSKANDEFLALAYSKEYALPVVIGRLFNTVGPRQTGQYGMVIPTFVQQALTGQPITVFGDGSQRRCFIHVGDVVTAIIDLFHSRQWGQVYNIGSDEEISMLELAHLVRQQTGSRSDLQFIPFESVYGGGFDDINRRIPDTSKLNALLGWAPKRRIHEIIAEVIQSVQEEISATSMQSK